MNPESQVKPIDSSSFAGLNGQMEIIRRVAVQAIGALILPGTRKSRMRVAAFGIEEWQVHDKISSSNSRMKFKNGVTLALRK